MDGGLPRWRGRKKLGRMEIASPGFTSPEEGEKSGAGRGRGPASGGGVLNLQDSKWVSRVAYCMRTKENEHRK